MSLRNYLTIEEVEEYADIVINDNAEGLDRIRQAEEFIDSYVGFQDQFLKGKYSGNADSGSQNTLVDSELSTYQDGFFLGATLEIVAGTNAREKRRITDFSKSSNQITVESNFSNPIDNTCVYIIYQVGKFPRVKDIISENNKIYPVIPEAVKRATAAQLQYMIEKGDDFFVGATDFDSESLDGYSYSTSQKSKRLIAPKARLLLKGIYNIKGGLK